MRVLNLLPKEEQRAVLWGMARRGVLRWTLASSCILAVGCIFLLPSLLSTSLIRTELERSLALEEAAGRRTPDGTIYASGQATRQSTDEIRAYALHPVSMGTALEKLLEPRNSISITSLHIRSDGDLALGGRATTREALLNFEETLRSSGRFLEVSFPLSDIVRERDIQFSAHGTLNPQYGK